jgi:hypothetical protein
MTVTMTNARTPRGPRLKADRPQQRGRLLFELGDIKGESGDDRARRHSVRPQRLLTPRLPAGGMGQPVRLLRR